MVVPSSVLGLGGVTAPSDRITVGLIGNGQMMRGHRASMLGRGNVQVLAVCDVKAWLRDAAKAHVEKAYAAEAASGTYHGCDAYNEYERVLERPDIDAVLVATPDHWHAAISIAAMRSGKDVYCEKPMTWTISEGRVVADTAERFGRVFQVGSQQRSNAAFRRAAEIVRNGRIGKVKTVWARLGTFPEGGNPPEEPIPVGFDYERWLGPAPYEPYSEERTKGKYTGGWRCFWDYGAKKNGDWGAHHFDIIQWALGMDHSGPVEFFPGGQNGIDEMHYRYADGTTVIKNKPGAKQMIQFFGENGTVATGRGNVLVTEPEEIGRTPLAIDEVGLIESQDHHGNWLDAVRTRGTTICDAEVGHRTATICHLMGIVERIGRPVRWDPEREEIVDDVYAARWVDRERRSPWFL